MNIYVYKYMIVYAKAVPVPSLGLGFFEPLLPGCGVVPRSLLVMCACACLETATELTLREHRKPRI